MRRIHPEVGRGGTRNCLLPFTVTEADVLLSPVSQVYSPLSVTSSLRMTKLWVVALCSMLYLSPWVSTVGPLSQVTLQSALVVSQDRVTPSPSLASQLCSSFLNVSGAAAGKNRDTQRRKDFTNEMMFLVVTATTRPRVRKSKPLNSTTSTLSGRLTKRRK